jgi:hypothetical protein
MSIRNSTALVQAIALLTVSGFAWGGNDVDKALGDNSDGDGKSAAAGFDSRVTIEAGDSDSNASFRVSSNSIRLGSERYMRFSLEAEAPFDKEKSDSVDVGTLSGLSSGTNATLGATWIWWPRPQNDSQKSLEAVCEDELPRFVKGFDWKEKSEDRKPFSLAINSGSCVPDLFTAEGLAAVVNQINQRVDVENLKIRSANYHAAREALEKCLRGIAQGVGAGKETPAPVDCALPQPVSAIPKATLEPLQDDQLLPIRERISGIVEGDRPPVHLLTIGASANRRTFSYVSADAPATGTDVERTGRGVSVAYTSVRKTWLWSVGYSEEKTFAGGDDVQICTPIGTTGSLRCESKTLGAPQEKNTGLVFAELRKAFPQMRVGLSPRIEFDTEESDWAIRLPMYLVGNGEGELTAGLALGYASKDSDFQAAVFVGKAFAFFDE